MNRKLFIILFVCFLVALSASMVSAISVDEVNNSLKTVQIDKENELGVLIMGTIHIPAEFVLELRKEPEFGASNFVGFAKKDEKVQILGAKGLFYKIRKNDGTIGWVVAACVKLDALPTPPVAEQTFTISNNFPGIHLSSTPSGNTFSGEILPGQKVTVISENGDFLLVRTPDGSTGYIAKDIFEIIKAGNTPETTTDPDTTPTPDNSNKPAVNAIQNMNLPDSASNLSAKMADDILNALGYGRFNSDKIKKFQTSRFGVWNKGKTYQYGQLDDATKAAILEMGKLLKDAMNKYGDATISKNSSQYNNWVKDAAGTISNMPGIKKNDGSNLSKTELMSGICKIESSKYHLRDGKMTISRCGAMGFMQIMPFHIPKAGNIFDPKVNLAFGATYINNCLGRADFKVGNDNGSAVLGKSLAAYNGGPNRKAFKSQTWDQIVRNKSIPSGPIGYAIKIKKEMGIPLTAAEASFRN